MEPGHAEASTVTEIPLPIIKESVEVSGQTIEYAVWDFRENQDNPPDAIDMYIDGFGQSADLNSIKKALILKAQRAHTVLVVPRTPRLPPATNEASPAGTRFDQNLDARLILQGLKSDTFKSILEANQLNIDFQSQNLNLTGFSDGNRIAITLAGLIDQHSPHPNPGITRRLNLWSHVGVVDLVDNPDQARGGTFLRAFATELLRITHKEIGWRYNRQVMRHQGQNPLTQKGFGILPLQSSFKDTLRTVGRTLFSQETAAGFFQELHAAQASSLNLLREVVERAHSAQSPTDLFNNLAKNELRSPVCDQLSLWDVNLTLPRTDAVTPLSAVGRALRRLSAQYRHTPGALSQALLFALPLCPTDAQLGWWFMSGRTPDGPDHQAPLIQNRSSEAKILFPNAKTVTAKIIGQDLSILSGHMGPIANPARFIN